jgi:phytoene desaturase
MADVVVVGGGVGGLAAALRLRAAGHAVRVLERRPALGGKLDVRVRDGFTFDTGPSLLTLPGVLDELFRVAGTRLSAEVDLTRLDPQIRYRWPDGSGFDASDDPEATTRAVDAFSPGGGAALRRFTAHGQRIWAVSERTFLAGPMSGPLDLLRRMRSPRDLTAIDPVRTLDAVARRTFSDSRLVQWAGRYATYSGSSPYRAPATLACIPAVEARHGVWYPAGGMGALRDALVRVAERTGVELATGCEVERIEASGARVRAVVTADGTRHRADVVVANVDAEHLYRDLLPDGPALTRTRRAGRSLSGFVVLAGVRGTTPGQAHHTVWFPADQALEFRQLVDGGVLADRPTIYACVPSVCDPTQAPPGHESWFLLVNAPAGVAVDRAAYQARLFDLLAAYGTDLRDRLCFTETITPADLAERYRAPGGAIYGASSNGRRAAFLRPANRGPRRGLYLVGGSSHPGGGLPLVAISGRIVAVLVGQDGW